MGGFFSILAGILSLPLHLFLWLKTGEPVHLDVVSIANHFDFGGWWAYPESWFGLWKFLHWLHISIFLGVVGFGVVALGLAWVAKDG